MRHRPDEASVPCNGCTACCKRELIGLYPEQGDLAERYETVDAVNPLTGRPFKALAQKPDGDCVYLTERGCSIHDKRPAICRAFDCRRFVRDLGTRADRRRAIKARQIDPAIVEAGLTRMSSLKLIETE